jgi:hypothetical protein
MIDKQLRFFNVLAIQEEFVLDNSTFPILLELEVEKGDLVRGEVIYRYLDVDEEGVFDFGELTDIVEALDGDTYIAIKEKIKEVVFQEIIVISANHSKQERLEKENLRPLRPLKQWICDSCGEKIYSGNSGLIKWMKSSPKENIVGVQEPRFREFQIVHNSEKCIGIYNKNVDASVVSIHTMKHLGSTDIVGYLMLCLEENQCFEPQEVIEIIKRLQIPYYEEGRRYLDVAKKDGFLPKEQDFQYSKRYLQNIVVKFKSKS